MSFLLLLIRLLLVGVFAVAAITKLLDRSGSRRAVTDFGLPASFARPLGLLIPLAELLVAILLLPTSTAWWGGLAALTLLLIFTAGISVNLARGFKPECHCFGQLHSAPVGWTTLFRNGLLAACSVFVLAQGSKNPGAGGLSVLQNFTSKEIFTLSFSAALVIAFVVETWFVIHLIKQNGRLLLRIDDLDLRLNAIGAPQVKDPIEIGLPVGAAAPVFELPLVSEGHLALSSLLNRAKSVLLVFSDPKCNPCSALLPDIAAWQRRFESELTTVVVSRGNKDDNREKVDTYGLKFVVIQKDNEIAEMYLANATPSAVLIGPDGSIRSPVAIGSESIIQLVARTTGTAAPIPLPVAGNGHHKHTHSSFSTRSSRIGMSAPSFRLPDLNGQQQLDLKDLQGRNVLLLFWNPSCRFCLDMVSELRSWESQEHNDLDLLVISTGTAEANRAMNLQSTVLIDQDFSVGRLFNAAGTPSAVLIDVSGKIASELAVGSTEVLALAQTGMETITELAVVT